MSNDRIPSEESLSAEQLPDIRYTHICDCCTVLYYDSLPFSHKCEKCNADGFDHEEQDECPDLCWMQKRAYDRFAEIDHEEQDEQTWLDKLRHFQHSLLSLKAKIKSQEIIASEIARVR